MALKLALALVAASLLAAAHASPVGTIPFKNCGSSSDPVTTSSISLTPASPKPGDNVTLVASGSTSVQITGGTFSLVATYLGITVQKVSGDICTSPVVHLQCPVPSGPASVSGSIVLPTAAPSVRLSCIVPHAAGANAPDRRRASQGQYVVTVKAADGSGNALFCSQFDINVQ